MQAVEKFDHAGLQVSIYPDDSPESPRDWCNVGEMVHWHRRYELGDREIDSDEGEAMSRGGFPLLERYLRLCRNAAIVLPLGLIDHSGLSMWVGRGAHICDPGGWDSGTVGFIWTTKEKVEEEWGGLPDAVEKAESYLRGEVEVYDQWLRGDVYGYVVESEDGEHHDSCWGFYGIDDVVAEAKSIAESIAHDIAVEVEPDLEFTVYQESR